MSSRSRPGVVGGDLLAELGDARAQRVGVDQDLADRPLELRLRITSSPLTHCSPVDPPRSRAPRQPRRRARRPASRRARARGTFASTKTSCTFLRRPARRSPGRRARTSSPGSVATRSSTGPTRTGPCSSETRSYSRTARMPPPRSAAFVPSRSASSSSSVSSSVARQARRARRRARGGSRSARRVEPSEQRDDLRRGSGRAACPGSTSRRGTRARPRGSTPRSPRARAASSGRTTPSSRRGLIPRGRAARGEPVEDGLDLVGGRVAGRAEAGRRVARSGGRGARPRCAPGGASTTSAPKRLAAERGVRSDSSPRSPWSRGAPRRGSRARRARARGRSSRPRRRRGR